MSDEIEQRRVQMIAGASGAWAIERIVPVRGPVLPPAPRLGSIEGRSEPPVEAIWVLSGVRSNERYVERAEKDRLLAVQQDLGRDDSTRAALIPIKKSEEWWQLTQDERRALFEDRSHHIAIGLDYLPQIARRLYHCHDLGGPFDFLTWFEFAPRDSTRFDDLVARLRATEEWRYVEREVEVRLVRDAISARGATARP